MSESRLRAVMQMVENECDGDALSGAHRRPPPTHCDSIVGNIVSFVKSEHRGK